MKSALLPNKCSMCRKPVISKSIDVLKIIGWIFTYHKDLICPECYKDKSNFELLTN